MQSEKKIHHIVVGGITTNCWVYSLENNTCAVIDPGEEGGRIIAFLDQLKLFPQYIILSHGHFDHIGAVPALAGNYRPSAVSTRDPQETRSSAESLEIAIHSADAECLGPDAYAVHRLSCIAAMGSTAYIDASWEDMPPPDSILAEGDSIGPFTVLHLPGHTPGSIGLWDKNAGILFSGDTLFRGNYGRTDLPGGSDSQMIASLKRLFAMDGSIQVFPGHGPVTTIENEKIKY